MYAPNVFTLDVAAMMAGADLGKEDHSYQNSNKRLFG